MADSSGGGEAAWRSERRRDGALAVLALGLLVGTLALDGRIDSLLDPRAAVPGVLGSLALEALLLRYPRVSRALWERRPVRAVGVALTVGGGVALLVVAGPWPAATLSWGLVAYLALLGVVLARGRNPLARLVDGDGR